MASPSKTEEEESDGERPRIIRATMCGRSGEEPSTRNPENSAVGPVCPRETEEMEDESEESCYDGTKMDGKWPARRSKTELRQRERK